MGASSPKLNWSLRRSGATSAGINDLGRGQTGQCPRVGVPLSLGYQGVNGGRRAGELGQGRDELDQGARLQEDESAVAVVVRQRPEGLVTQRHLGAQPPGPFDV